jgi:YidC/Oxa1 family membrane protein insertase
MDKKTLIGIVLIAAVMIGWMLYTSSVREEIPPEQSQNIEKKQEELNNSDKEKIENSNANIQNDSILQIAKAEKFGEYFEKFADGKEQFVTIETDNFTTIISNKGGSLVRWRLKSYNKWDGNSAQLLGYDSYELCMKFTTTDLKKIDSRDLFFEIEGIENDILNNNKIIKLSGEEKQEIAFKIDLGNGKELVKSVIFQGDKYHIDQNIKVNNLDGILKGGYVLAWENSLNFQEKNSVDEANYTNGIISMNGSIEDFNVTDNELQTQDYTGVIDYLAIKTKYFTTAIIPQPWQNFDGTANLSGEAFNVKNKGIVEKYQMAINVPYKGGNQENSFQIFIGPIEYDLVKSYGLEATVDLGWRFLIRPIAEYLILPLFTAVHRFIPNYGIAIIIFSILMKILLYPLSIKQIRNASYMKLLAPEMEKNREKFKDDMQKQQMATMQLYSEYGINPAGGCLPLLVQMPILIALWRTLNATIELRQQPFILWINDLSRPDILFGWNFSILGLSHISGLALLMAVAMFLQQKMTIIDPKQKAMIYMMPVMFLFMFSNFPSGLNLYYFVFNLLAITQQVYANKFSSKKLTLEQLKAQTKKNPKKEGWLQKQMRQVQEMQAQGGKPLPPSLQKYMDAKQGSQKNNDLGKKVNQAQTKKKRK